MAYYVAVDLGTTGCRSIVFDERLNTIGSSYEEYGLIIPKDGWVEQDAELWWALTLRTLKQAVERAKINAKEILALSVSSQGITIVPVNEQLKPLCNALTWLDIRAESQTEIIRKDYDDTAFFALTGKEIKSVYTLPKLLWLKENKSEIFEKAYKFLMPMDYLIAQFTGKVVTDYSMASGTLAYDLKNACWNEEICNRYGIPVDKLPKLAWSGTPIGTLRKELVAELGLSDACVVAVGAQDQKCAAFGAGLSENTISISLGTAAAITKVWKELSIEKKEHISYCGYVSPTLWVSEGVIDTAGTCLRCVRDSFYKGSSYEKINEEVAESVKKEEDLFFNPYLSGGLSADEKETLQNSFYGITSATTRGSYACAVMEGIAFEMRAILEKMHAYEKENELVLFGGGAKSEPWCQIIANVTGLPVKTLVSSEAASAGAARLAALACGERIPPLKTAKVYQPIKQEYYFNKYQRYCELVKNI